MAHLKGCGVQDSTSHSRQHFEADLRNDPLLAYSYEAWAYHALASIKSNSPSAIARVEAFVSGCKAFPDVLTGRYTLLGPYHVAARFGLPLLLAGSEPCVEDQLFQLLVNLYRPDMTSRERDRALCALIEFQEQREPDRLDSLGTVYEKPAAMVVAEDEGEDDVVEIYEDAGEWFLD